MSIIHSFVSILHEIVLDFSIVLLDTAARIKTAVRAVSLKITFPAIPTAKIQATYTAFFAYLPQSKYLTQYWRFLCTLYDEVDEALEDGKMPLFFVAVIPLILLLGFSLFYIALVS